MGRKEVPLAQVPAPAFAAALLHTLQLWPRIAALPRTLCTRAPSPC